MCKVWDQMHSINSELTKHTDPQKLTNTIEDFRNEKVYLQHQFKLLHPNTK